MKEGYLSRKDTAALLNVSERMVSKLVASGKLAVEKSTLSGRVRFLKADVEAVIAQRTAVAEAKKFIGSPSLNLRTINAPYSGPARDPDDSFHLVQVGPATVRKVEGPAPPVEPSMTPAEQNAAFIEEQAHAPVIWVGDQGFQGIDEHGRTAEVRALQYQEELRNKQRKAFRQVRGV